MHGKLGQPYIHGIHGHLCHQNIAQGTSACNIRAVGVSLKRYTGFPADVLHHCRRVSVRCITLGAVVLNHNAFIEPGLIDRIGLFGMIGVYGMGIVG